MSLIHLGSRTTSSEQAFLDAGLSDSSLILIDAATVVESFSIELTVGAIWSNRYDTTDNAMLAIPSDGIDIANGVSVVVEVAEKLRLPHNMYGLIVPTGRLFLDRGIIIAAAKIEPSFNDRLKLRMVNVSGSKRTIGSGQKIASAIFFTTERTVYHDEVRKGAVVANTPSSLGKRFAKWRAANGNQLVTWAFNGAAILLSAAALIVSILSYRDKEPTRTATPAAITGRDEPSPIDVTNATGAGTTTRKGR